MEQLKELSTARCILLATSLASEANVQHLQKLTSSRPDVLGIQLTLRILLSCLPETVDPSLYITFLDQLASETLSKTYESSTGDIDCARVTQITEHDARAQVQKLKLLRLAPSKTYTALEHAPDDALIQFLIHRAHRIDAETGLLSLVPPLLSPFLHRSRYLRHWFLSSVLPLARLEYEYHISDASSMDLERFESLDGPDGVGTIMSKSLSAASTADSVAQDLRGVMGPWTFGSSQRKRRKLGRSNAAHEKPRFEPQDVQSPTEKADRVAVWHDVYRWIVGTAVSDLSQAHKVFEAWDGPGDIDLGGYDDDETDEESDRNSETDLRQKYCQTALACIYATENGGKRTTLIAHSLLSRLAELLKTAIPPDLTLDANALPQTHISNPSTDVSITLFHQEALLVGSHPLTRPSREAFSIAQNLVISSHFFCNLGIDLSITRLAKLWIWGDKMEQQTLFQGTVDALLASTKQNEAAWLNAREFLFWLRGWTKLDDTSRSDCSAILGKVDILTMEQIMLKAMCMAGHTSLAHLLYLNSANPLSNAIVEETVVDVIYEHYDHASNGNKSRGEMKKAADTLSIFRAQFQKSPAFHRCNALIAATHALSFYSLTIQQGVPFEPANIRQSEDPMSLISKVLNQNSRSYTKLDDLIDIGRNLIIAIPTLPSRKFETQDENLQVQNAERRITGMAIEAALAEEDFETAYSYVVNRLSPTTDSTDDISWRAAFQAGRHRSSTLPKASLHGSPEVRRLEQRMELLAQSLSLAPPSALSEVLAAWRRCEEELLAMLAHDSGNDVDLPEHRSPGPIAVPGGFARDSGTSFQVQPRRQEIGRGAGEEAPMGLFDVARGAAAAFGRSAGALRTDRESSARSQLDEAYHEDQERVRKRDMVANAVTGGLASGLGWVLGAKPMQGETQ